MCGSYGQSRGLIFNRLEHYSRDESTTVCLYADVTGAVVTVPFHTISPFVTDVWVSVALDLKFTIGVFAVSLGLLRTLVRPGSESHRADATTPVDSQPGDS